MSASEMSAAHLSSSTETAVAPPLVQSTAEALEEVFRPLRIAPPDKDAIARLAPWTDEEADAFERVINEMFEQIDEPVELP